MKKFMLFFWCYLLKIYCYFTGITIQIDYEKSSLKDDDGFFFNKKAKRIVMTVYYLDEQKFKQNLNFCKRVMKDYFRECDYLNMFYIGKPFKK